MKRRHNEIDDSAFPVFVTSTIVEWIPVFAKKELAENCLHLLEEIRQEMNISVSAYVLMPNHFHGIIHGHHKGDCSKFMQDLKYKSSRLIIEAAKCSKPLWLERFRRKSIENKRTKKQTHQVWIPGFDCEPLSDEKQYYAGLTYIHNNPLKDGIVKKIDDFPFSSYHDYNGRGNAFVKIDRGPLMVRNDEP